MKREVYWRAGIGYVTTLLKSVKTKLTEDGPGFARLAFSVVAVIAISYNEPASAGTGGKCNTIAPYLGYAWAEVTVTNANGTTTRSYITTPTNTASPCAFVGSSTTTCSTYRAALPAGAYGSAYAKAGIGVIIGTCTNSANCSSGNSTVENLLNLTPGPCASYNITDGTGVAYDPNNPNSGTLTLSVAGTLGSGLLFRGYEAPPGLDPNDPDFESILFSQGTLLFFVPLVGPFDTTGCPTQIPFTPKNPNNVWIFTDGAAVGTALTIQCPIPDQVYAAGATVVYPTPGVSGGCGGIKLTYSPPASSLPCGMSTVTVTATDSIGSTATCSFNATRQLTFGGFLSPVNAVSPAAANPTSGGCSLLPVYTASSQNKNFPLKFTTQCGGVFFPGASPPFVKVYSCTQNQYIGAESGFASKDTSNVWHFNIDLTIIALGKYIADVQLQDNSHQYLVFQVGK